ncbi:non-ribosomal peptide synthetase [[Flexibacter] sp. ATCC 35208]|uniref:non-ribosomal peptide synthetase n=1 Tax=[Flexibacter] sp. ATCC 35208 TaxID=1936242 RepID=UPI0009D02BAF|nr:non-ribosomal peptide synthetase [[Flexibacter] sp. ATCC 35208]OMP77907.1 hypothetical protein BW716_17685 [[Flexibacter] sp. ATCC 35208]
MSPLTFPQQDIYYDQLIYPDTAIYNIGAKIAISGPLNRAALELAYQRMIEEHDAFRTIIILKDNEPWQEVLAHIVHKLEWKDYSAAVDADETAELYMQQEFARPFLLHDNMPPYRFCLIKISDDFHYLFSVYHHIITDGWGTSLLFQRLVGYYNSLLNHGSLPSSTVYTYSSFIADDAVYSASDSFLAEKEYWTGRFNTLPKALIPGKRLPGKKPESGRKELVVPRALYNRLAQLAQQCGVSTFHVILGVLYTYLGRFYNNYDFAIGLPVLNRGKFVYKQTVGLFTGVTLLRIDFKPESSFRELVSLIKQQLRKDYRYQRFPLGKLIRELNIHGNTAGLFNVNVSYEKQDYAADFAGTSTRVIPLTHRQERLALSLYVREFDEKDDVKLDFDYSLDHLDETSIGGLVKRFDQLLNEVILFADKPLYNLNWLPAEEHMQIITAEQNFRAHPTDTVVALFRQRVKYAPEDIALRDEHLAYSYGELNRLSQLVAGHLNCRQDRAPVAVLMDRSATLPLVLLGILRSGRAFIPLDPAFPTERLEYIVRHSGAQLLITDRTTSFELEVLDVATLLTGGIAGIEDNSVLTDAAYIIYTSGSTGNPKGVEISHAALSNFLFSMQHSPGISYTDTLFAVTTYSFDIAILELLLPLISGASVYVATAEILADPDKLLHTMATVKPNIIQATPSFYQLLFNAGWEGASGLKCLCGGDVLGEALAEKLLNHTDELWNMYGPTETTIWSSVKRIRRPAECSCIGHPIDNTSIYILDKWMNRMPLGAEGDIYIGGAGLAIGYYKNNVLTDQAFLLRNGERIYRTGDTGRRAFNGELIFLGRTDNQVKIRGYRIELGDIESKLAGIEGIREAVVVSSRPAMQEAFLVAYMIPVGEPIPEKEILSLLKAALPTYMVPQVLIYLDAYPLTPNRKIDRKALSEREIRSASVGNPVVELYPVNAIKLLVYWRQVLGVEQIGIDDHFFSLGGHSLSAVKLVSLINKEWGAGFTITDVFEHPTIRLQSVQMEQLATKVTVIPIAEAARYYPVTRAQYHIWLLSQQRRAAAAYNMSAAFLVQGPLDLVALRKALLSIAARHEIMRTNFIEHDGIPYQHIKAFGDLQIVQLEGNAVLLTDEFVHRPFDLERDLLFRVALVRPENILVFVTHHLIMDGWSVEVLLQELIAIYNGRSVPSMSYQFKDYSAWLGKVAAEDKAAIAYWDEQLSEYIPRPVLMNERNSRVMSFKGRQYQFAFPALETSHLRQLAREQGTTTFTVITALFQLLLYKYDGSRDSCIGTVTAGRDVPGSESQLGMYANTCMLRSRIDPDKDFLVLLKETGQTIRQAAMYAYNLPERANAYFDIMIVYQPFESLANAIKEMNELSLEPFPLDVRVSRFPLVFNFREQQDEIACEVVYDADIFSSDAVQLLIARYCKLAAEVTVNPAQLPDEYKMMLIKESSSDTINIDFNF